MLPANRAGAEDDMETKREAAMRSVSPSRIARRAMRTTHPQAGDAGR